MSNNWDDIAKSFWDEQPHPHAPSLKISEFATAVKLASMAKFGGHASAHEAALFWPEFQATGLSPEEFEHTLDRIAPLSYRLHGRPPTMKEIAQLKDKAPHEARKYFADLPDKHHPEITAGDMVKSYQAARPWARQHLEREPVKSEVAYLHHSGEAASTYYARIAQKPPEETTIPSGGSETQERADAGGRRVDTPRRPQAYQ